MKRLILPLILGFGLVSTPLTAIAQSVDAILSQAGRAHREKLYQDALSAYDRALRIAPNRADIWDFRGRVLMDLALPSDALASFDRALSLNPNGTDTLSARGYALLRLRQWREAFNSFERATRLNNRNAPAWNGKAIALMGLNRNADSLSAAVTALSLNPRYGHALFRRGFVLDEMGRYNEALQAYREALRHYPERRSTVLHNQGITLLNLKRYQDAVESFDSAIRDDRYDDDPDWDVKSADSWYGKGFAEYQLGKFRAAAGSFRRALNLRANFPEAQEALEATRQRLGGNESSINF